MRGLVKAQSNRILEREPVYYALDLYRKHKLCIMSALLWIALRQARCSHSDTWELRVAKATRQQAQSPATHIPGRVLVVE